MFGKLFEEAIELGLPAIQTQHPGFYYQQAAQHAVNRKKICYHEFVSLDADIPKIDLDYAKVWSRFSFPSIETSSQPFFYVSKQQLDFYGQRPWRANRLSLEPSDMKVEVEGIANCLIAERLQLDHTALIVAALTSAVNQFKNYKSPRMKQYLRESLTKTKIV